MAFTAQDVKTLREMTGVGMMDCKKALSECDGDMDKAVEYLREKGLAKAAKKAGRIAAEGMAYAAVCPECGVGAVVEVNCETDFCAKSDLFVSFVKDICKVVLKDNPADIEALQQCKYPNSELTVAETMPEKVMSIGENLQLRRFARFGENTSVAYVHAGGKIGVLVTFEVEGIDPASADFQTYGRDVAMQVAAASPVSATRESVPAEVVEHEKSIYKAQAAESGKPEAIQEKMATGRLEKFYKENCLTEQAFVKNPDQSVLAYTDECAKKLGGTITVTGFTRWALGEN